MEAATGCHLAIVSVAQLVVSHAAGKSSGQA